MSVVLRRVLILACSLLLLQIASDVWPQTSTTKLSGLGYLDYRGKPRFKVGDWVTYHFTSKSDGGGTEDHELTILISGEEKFWGDDCFWIETWSGARQSQTTAILVSYSIFGDPNWLQHLQVYQRKSMQVTEDGLIQELIRRVLVGKATGENRPTLTVLSDTLGPDTATVKTGLYHCLKVGRKAGVGSVLDQGDSTVRIENWDRRTLYLSPKVHMTSLVREVDERWITRKAWQVGHSADAVQSYLLRGTGVLDLVAFGSGGLEPRLTPAYARRGMARTGDSRLAKPTARKRS